MFDITAGSHTRFVDAPQLAVQGDGCTQSTMNVRWSIRYIVCTVAHPSVDVYAPQSAADTQGGCVWVPVPLQEDEPHVYLCLTAGAPHKGNLVSTVCVSVL
jgi:hypothetical protein